MLEYVGILICCIFGYSYYVEDENNGEKIEEERRYITNTKTLKCD